MVAIACCITHTSKNAPKNANEVKNPADELLQPLEKVVINKLTDENLDIYENLSNRRNELTHQSEPEPPTIKEAVINFYLVRKIGIEIGKCFNDPSVNEIDFPPLINEIHNE